MILPAIKSGYAERAAVSFLFRWLPVLLFPSTGVQAAPLHLDFVHEINSKPLLIDSLRYENSRRESLSVTRLAWLATGFSVTLADGEQVDLPEAVAYVANQGTTISFSDLPAKQLRSITFHIGPDKETNHADPARHNANSPLNPNINALHWDWQGGYIFLAIEGHWRTPDQKLPDGYAYHFARDPNRTAITLPLDLDLRNESRVAIALDPLKLLDGLSFATDGTTTHSSEGDPVSDRLKANLASAFRIAGIRSGGVPQPKNSPSPIDLPANPKPFPIRLPRHIPLPALPSDNPIIEQRVTLGDKLFHEPKLSRNNTIACASCHQGDALADSRRFSPGVDGEHGTRHSMPLFNLAWKSRFFWDGRATSLREQSLQPIQDHLEMDESLENVVAKLRADPAYPPLFSAAFGSGTISPQSISLAIENFLLTRMSFESKLDQSLKGKATLTPQEKRGFELFFTETEPRLGKRGADCFHCHGGAHFTDHGFHNNGLAPTTDMGLEKTTGLASDRFKFSTPSLRNIAITAPYMHDGRFATLEEVIDHYDAAPVLSETLDPNLAKHRGGLGLSVDDKAALVAFLKIL
ncbi:MAG: cytochrome C peroxidase [Verrucomicrobiae bacterium]|nr:cytochrome C peroxidase [Verrucomicrobiae bacterium]